MVAPLTGRAGGASQSPATSGGAFHSIVNRVLGAIAALLIFLMLCVTAVDVIGRYGFNRPLPGASEITEVMLATMIFAALPLVTLENGHITMTLLTDRFSAQGRRIQGVLVSLFSAFILSLVAWRLYCHGMQLSSYGDVTVFLHLAKGPLAYLLASLAGIGALAEVVLMARFLFGRAGSGKGMLP